MKKLITSMVTLVLVLSLAACGSGDNTDDKINVSSSSTDLKGEDNKDVMTEKVPKTTKTPEVTEASEVSNGRTVSGFDTKTNKTITWSGIGFSLPSYFDVLDKGSTETWMHYYPEEEDYYASVVFEIQDYSGTEEEFISKISQSSSLVKDKNFTDKELLTSEKTSIAGLPGWTYTFAQSDTKGERVISTIGLSFAYNINTGKIVMITCNYDSKDKSHYDYLGDYKKMLKTAKLLTKPLDLNAIKSTNSAEKPKVEILTVDNCKELAEILSTKDEFDPLIKEFAEKYAGRTIEFDGNTAYVSKHGNYKTRFDYLIYAGDYSKTTFSGPNFQFRDVNYYDLHLTGDNVPDTFGIGLNIHIIATVDEYNETSGLFQLKPVSIKMR